MTRHGQAKAEGREQWWMNSFSRTTAGRFRNCFELPIRNCFKVDFELLFWFARRHRVCEIKRNIIVHFPVPLSPRLSYKRWCAFTEEIESGWKEIILVNHGIYCNSCTLYYYIFIIFYIYIAIPSWVFGMREKGFVVNLLHAINYFENWNNACTYIRVYV